MISAAAVPQPAEPVPDPSSSPGASGSTPGLISIGEVLAQLREDFPDVTISKLRFLEAEGLVEPQRTPAGYRKYSEADVQRLRYVLAAQRDRFLPLRVIRDQLAAIDRGEADANLGDGVRPAGSSPGDQSPDSSGPPSTGEVGAAAGPTGPIAGLPLAGAVSGTTVARTRFSRAEVLERSGLTDEMLSELEATGLLGTRSPGWYDGDALAVAEVAGAFAIYGLAPRHLRAYRAGADREVGMFAQLLAPLQRSSTPAARARAAEVVQELTMLSQQLHAALVRIGLRDTLGR
jgi:DNA-binding transcriptional MerR regulator